MSLSTPAQAGATFSASTYLLTRPLQLDGPSVAEEGERSNKLFQVEVDGQPISYQGMMARRAPPGRHRLTVKSSHRNHFSPDDRQLESKPVTIELGDSPIRQTPKP